MAKKLKTYQTSLGFFDLAIAAPSMKAALDAWGARSNLFHQGVAKETDDPEVVGATMSRPGVVLRRPVGTKERFSEHAELPADLSGVETKSRREKRDPKPKPHQPRKIDEKEARRQRLAFEREQGKRDNQRRKEETARAKERERRDAAIGKAQAALDEARREHEAKQSAIEAERAALDKRAQDEEARWQKKKEKLDMALRRARE